MHTILTCPRLSPISQEPRHLHCMAICRSEGESSRSFPCAAIILRLQLRKLQGLQLPTSTMSPVLGWNFTNKFTYDIFLHWRASRSQAAFFIASVLALALPCCLTAEEGEPQDIRNKLYLRNSPLAMQSLSFDIVSELHCGSIPPLAL